MPKAQQHNYHVYTDWKRREDGVLCIRCQRCGHLEPVQTATKSAVQSTINLNTSK